MREIKFRAWDKKRKKMGIIDSLDFTLSGRDHLWGFFQRKGSKNVGKSFSEEDVELMQYTGLKDKNGKEIYEGDILQLWNYSGIKLKGLEVVEFELDGDGDHYSYAGYDTNYWKSGEIIGNIYENKELLK